MSLKIPRADFYHVGLHKTGSTYLSSQIFPLFDDVNVRQHDHSLYGNFYEWESNAQHAALFANNFISGDPDGMNSQSIALVRAANPEASIIIGIRSQATMLRSIYWLCVKTGDARSFDQFVEDVIANGKLDYAQLVDSYRQVFGPDNVLVLLFEELTQQPEKSVKRLAQFFDVAAPEFHADKTNPVKVTPGDLEILTRRTLNDWASRRNQANPHLAIGKTGKGLIAAAHRADRLLGRKSKRLSIPDQDRLVCETYGGSNRALFGSLYETPFAETYPGVGDVGSAKDAKT